ncbi:MAG: Holliday junction branch migration protein RuvA [Clostridiales bacterium]|nr:Holliday junction branch migration protein RuvA [Clostridiales bacterium]
MFAYINGILDSIEENEVVIDVHGIGYLVTVPSSVVDSLPARGENLKLYTYFVVREDAQEIYGFIDIYQKRMFQKLITVSGIGPKVGLSILSSIDTIDISTSIVSGDIDTLTRAPGVGRKTAQRIIFELKDKMGDFQIEANLGRVEAIPKDGQLDEVIEALLSLGYSKSEANSAAAGIGDAEGSVSDLIKMALKNLDR